MQKEMTFSLKMNESIHGFRAKCKRFGPRLKIRGFGFGSASKASFSLFSIPKWRFATLGFRGAPGATGLNPKA